MDTLFDFAITFIIVFVFAILFIITVHPIFIVPIVARYYYIFFMPKSYD